MSKLLSSIVFSFFLLFQTTSFAEQPSDIQQEAMVEEVLEEQNAEVPEVEAVPETTAPEPEVTDDISEAQREADAAEAAELREAGEGEEPVSE